MRILFTASTTIMGRAIRWIFKEDCSHVAINFDRIVFHSNLLGVHLEWLDRFLDNCTIKHTIDVPLNLWQEEKVYQILNRVYDGKGYDYGGMLGLAYHGLRLRFFGIPLPKKNDWGDPYRYMCMEIIEALKEQFPQLKLIKDIEIVTPHQLYIILNNK